MADKKKKASPKRRKKPTKEELDAIKPDKNPEPDDLTLSSRLGNQGGRKLVRLFNIPGDSDEYHEIINSSDRYTVIEQVGAWNKDKGMVVGRTICLFYVDRFPDPSE